MNKERVLQVALAIEKGIEFNSHPVAFDMGTWFTSSDSYPSACGTSACIAGHVALLGRGQVYPLGLTPTDWLSLDHPRTYGKEWLDLTENQAEYLFTSDRALDAKPSAEIAVQVLRHLAETGEVRWDKFLPDEDESTWEPAE